MNSIVLQRIQVSHQTLRVLLRALRNGLHHAGVLAHIVGHAAGMHRAAIVHAGKVAGTTNEAKEIIPVHAVSRSARGVGKHQGLTTQLVAGRNRAGTPPPSSGA